MARFAPSKGALLNTSSTAEVVVTNLMYAPSNINSNLTTSTPTSSAMFTCNICPYVSPWKSNLKKHMAIHCIEKPFSCPHCNYTSNFKGDVSRHVKLRHREPQQFPSMHQYPKQQQQQNDEPNLGRILFPPGSSDHFQDSCH